MKVPAEQSSPFGLAPEKDQTIVAPPAPDMQVAAAGAATSSPIPATASLPRRHPRRHGDRGNKDGDDGGAAVLSVLCRFADLKRAGIVENWPTLSNLIEKHGFPPGIRLSTNKRVWRVADVERWLDMRPIERKPLHPRRNNTELPEASLEGGINA